MSNTISLDRWLGLAELNNTITVTSDSPEARKIGGQMVVIDGNSCYVWIKKGAWLTAGREFNWKKKGVGFGINKTIVDYADTHDLTIRIINATTFDKCYQIRPSEIIEFVEKTNSIDYKRGVTLYVIPWSRCKTTHEDVGSIISLLEVEI